MYEKNDKITFFTRNVTILNLFRIFCSKFDTRFLNPSLFICRINSPSNSMMTVVGLADIDYKVKKIFFVLHIHILKNKSFRDMVLL